MNSNSAVAPGPPVIVLGTGVTALGVLRILSRNGISGFVSDASEPLLRLSRRFKALPGSHPPIEDRDLGEWLPQLPFDRAVLMPCSDHWARRVARLDESLRHRFPASISSADTIERFLDKGRFAQTLHETGTAHPFSRVVANASDLDSVPDAVFRSAFLKPHDSQRFMARFGVKALHVASRQDACRQLDAVTAEGHPMIFQEYVPGPATRHYHVDGFLDRFGSVRATFVRQRLRMYPLDFGNNTYMVSVSPSVAQGAVAAIASLLGRFGYRGVFSAEFKLDPRDDVFKLLEVNARAWWYVDFAARCGVDVCRMAYQDALDRPVPEVRSYAIGRTHVYPYFDYFACRALRQRGELSLWQWARSWLSSGQPVFQLGDPLPGLGGAMRIVSRFVGHQLRKLVPAH